MCGVFLYYNQESTGYELASNYRTMSASLARRGPDAMGVTAIPARSRPFLEKTVKTDKKRGNEKYCAITDGFFQNAHGFVGHHRLAIIDPDPASTQPFLDPASDIALAYNGAVYNYVELRRELMNLGHNFLTSSDTEVVLHAYLAWDTDCFQRFNGDFALLIYDHRKRSIIGARDRFGVKPLYFHHKNKTITFSSEAKGFLRLPGYTPALNEEVAYHYLVADFPTIDTLKESFLKDVYSVPPAHWFEVDLDSLAIAFTRYWDIQENSFDAQQILSIDEAVKRFDALLENAVKIRLRSDVTLGSFLSGGLDSPSIVWHAIKDGNKIPTFSSIFPGSPVDESKNINVLVKDFNVTNYQQQVDFDGFVQEIPSLVLLQDEPFSTLNVYAQYKNLQYARDHGVKAILDGSGADEFLAGYADYRLLAAAGSGDDSYLTDREKERLERFITLSASDLCAWHNVHEREVRTVNYINPEVRQAYRGDPLSIDRPLDPNYKKQFMGSCLKNGLFHSTTGSWMNKSIPWDNRYLDRTGMWLGIEGRVPFQDHRLVEFVFSLPPDYIYRDGFSKYILRKSMENRLPHSITGSRKKMGFEFPFTELVADNRTFRDYFYDLTEQQDFKEFNIIDRDKVVTELDNIKNRQSNNYNLWRVFNLYLWCSLFIT